MDVKLDLDQWLMENDKPYFIEFGAFRLHKSYNPASSAMRYTLTDRESDCIWFDGLLSDGIQRRAHRTFWHDVYSNAPEPQLSLEDAFAQHPDPDLVWKALTLLDD